VLTALGVALTALSPEIIAIVAGDAYAGARDAIGPLVGGMVMLGAFVLVSAVVGASGSTRRVAAAALGGAGLQALLSAWLVPAYGLAGAGIASLGGYTLAAAVLLGTERPLLRAVAGGMAALIAGVATLALVAAAALAGAPSLTRVAVAVLFGGLAAVLAAAIARRRNANARA
jgi:O-antigen/teichoic acid export membrane protein